jgi:hypothetical protein
MALFRRNNRRQVGAGSPSGSPLIALERGERPGHLLWKGSRRVVVRNCCVNLSSSAPDILEKRRLMRFKGDETLQVVFWLPRIKE